MSLKKKSMTDADVLAILSNHEYVTGMLQKGIYAALLKHKLAGNAICSSENGKVVWIKPEKIPVGYSLIRSKVPLEVQEKIDLGQAPLKAWREYRGYSRTELAEKIGVSRQYIYQLENNEKTGSILSFRKISEALGVSLEDILPQ